MKRALIVTVLVTFGGAVDAVAQDTGPAQVRLQAQVLQKLMDVSVASDLEIRLRWIARVTAPPTAVVPVVSLTAPVVKTKGASWVHPDYAPSLAALSAPRSPRRTGGKR